MPRRQALLLLALGLFAVSAEDRLPIHIPTDGAKWYSLSSFPIHFIP